MTHLPTPQKLRLDSPAYVVPDYDGLRVEFLRRLTQDGPTRDRRRRDFNQAVFDPNGWAVWSETSLDMVMDKFDRAVRTFEETGHA